MSKSGKHGPDRSNPKIQSHTFTKRVEKSHKKNKIAKMSRKKNR